MPIRLLEKFINNISLSAEEKIVETKFYFKLNQDLNYQLICISYLLQGNHLHYRAENLKELILLNQ